ncbi:M16 family metallopeptidase [Desulfurivibrio dismutans]|uniref:M16 family metallopeptidase n=1 Tax=Desulfurivibrio dismutans TaxID=1398908 RepID=UPI0023DB06E3|nr:pitrilysin family protein [Desulfurivibrio alkaliphilus]MDF1613978.1 pitrilysin family protein [Desulfurivibrio alkaliphilus]
MTTSTDIHAEQISPRLYKSQLDNGLTVITRETPGTGVATVQIWVEAGSVYERSHEAGITHFIEHMIFKGTPSRGPGEVAGAIEAVGGRINAYTSFEHTVYHATLDARHWGAAMEVLADAVLNSLFDPEELEREKPVIHEEIRMRRDRPELHLFQEMMAHAYQVHPYRLPISGTEESVAAISRDDILAYLERHYHPDNFTVVVVGDVRAAQVLEKSRRLFGNLPRREATDERDLPQEPPPTEFRFFQEEQSINQTHLALAFPIPAFKHPDTAALNVLSQILGPGEASRLNERLRHELGLVYQIDTSMFSSRDPGIFRIGAVLDADNSREVIKEAMAEILALQHSPVSDEELDRARRNLEADFVFNLERAEGMARVLGSFELLTGDPREHEYLERLRGVEAEDIMRVAATYFKPPRLTAGILAPEGSDINLEPRELAAMLGQAGTLAKDRHPATAGDSTLPPHTHRFRLDNGITLLIREQRDVPTVAVRAVFPGGLRGETPLTNGAFTFISELLPRGAGDLDFRRLARTVADMAAEIDGFSGRNTFGLKGDFLARFFDQGLIIMRDILLTPAFAPDEAEKVRAELLANLRRQEDSLSSVAFREFNRSLFHGHPYALNTLGSTGTIQSLTADDLRKIYRQHARPNQLVLSVVGDVDADGVKNQVEELFGDWAATAAADQGAAAVVETLLPPEPPVRPEIVNLTRDREQVHIIIGFLGTTITDRDRYALEILDQVLSGQSGRLFTELRDRRSLAYSLSSFSLLGTDTGSFGVYIGTSPEHREEAIKELWAQLYRVLSEPISDIELERARNVLIGNYRLGLQTNGAQAMEMALNETYELGLDFATHYPRRLEATSAEEVLAAARRYLLPERYIMVTIGGE